MEVSRDPNHRQGTTGTQEMLRVRGIVFLKVEPHNELSNTKWSPLKPYIQVTRYSLYITCIHVIASKEIEAMDERGEFV